MKRSLTVLALVVSVSFLAGCSAAGTSVDTTMAGCGCDPLPPADLPLNPDPCLKYCADVEPAIYRDVPRIVQTCGPTTREVTVVERETRYEEVMIKPETCKTCTLPGSTCDQSLVQVQPGGWKWENEGSRCGDGGCWQYKYNAPKYEWCNRTVKEEGIEYCTQQPAEYETRAYTVPVTRTRTEYVPAQYEIVWGKELYRPAQRVWRTTQDCGCDFKPLPTPCSPARTPRRGAAITSDCLRCN